MPTLTRNFVHSCCCSCWLVYFIGNDSVGWKSHDWLETNNVDQTMKKTWLDCLFTFAFRHLAVGKGKIHSIVKCLDCNTQNSVTTLVFTLLFRYDVICEWFPASSLCRSIWEVTISKDYVLYCALMASAVCMTSFNPESLIIRPEDGRLERSGE